jgi:hypothetical protein
MHPAHAPQSLGFATPSFDFTKDALQKILDSIADTQDGKIETSTLQIVCRYVEEELVSEKKITTITGELLGDISDIFKHYYEGILAKLNDADREKVQRLIEDELIEQGRRNTLTDVYIKNRFGFDDHLLSQLEQSSLLRKERDATGRILYEISHDSLVNAIEKVAKGRREIEEQVKRKKLEDKLAEERERAEYLTQLNKKAVFRTRLAVGLSFVSLVIAAVAFYFWQSSKRATVKANEQTKAAETALFKNNMQKARTLLEDVRNSYLLSKDYNLALRNLNIADSLLTINVELPAKDKNERELLLKNIAECRNDIPETSQTNPK